MADVEGRYCQVHLDGDCVEPLNNRWRSKMNLLVIGGIFVVFVILVECVFTSTRSASAIESIGLSNLQSSSRVRQNINQIIPAPLEGRGRPTGHVTTSGTSAGLSETALLGAVSAHMETLPRTQSPRQPFTRRGAIGAATASMFSSLAANAATASEEEIEVYFGCGCFWHVQHEFVEAERKILQRDDLQLTSRVGYAGGNGGLRDGKVCYHNRMRMSEYGDLGHAEVVRLRIPPSSFRQFADEYFALFDAKGNRPDQNGDVGLEYRNLVGIPGGMDSPHAKELMEASKANGNKIEFAMGKGTDPDVRAKAFIMDSTKYPFYQGEVYHQFHDGFKFGEDYPDSYNLLTSRLFKAGQIVPQGCPDIVRSA